MRNVAIVVAAFIHRSSIGFRLAPDDPILAFLPSDCWAEEWGPFNFPRCCLDQAVAHADGCWSGFASDALIDAMYAKCCLNQEDAVKGLVPPETKTDLLRRVLVPDRVRIRGKNEDDPGGASTATSATATSGSSPASASSVRSSPDEETGDSATSPADALIVPVVQSPQTTAALLALTPENIRCGCTPTSDKDNHADRMFCQLHRSISLTHELDPGFTYRMTKEMTIAEVADCPLGALALTLATALVRAKTVFFGSHPLTSPAFVYAETGLLLALSAPRIGLMDILHSGWDLFTFVDLLRQVYVPQGWLAAYSGWECFRMDPVLESYMEDAHRFALASEVGISGRDFR